MKTSNSFYYLSILFLIILAFSCIKNSDIAPKKSDVCKSYQPSSTLDKYNFPIRPGMPSWANIKSGEEMIKVLQIPDAVLKKISSEGLLETCLDYPLLGSILAFNSLQIGTRRQIENFNGFQELNKRTEAGLLLLNRYKNMDVSCFSSSKTSIDSGNYTLSFTYFEMIIAQDEYLSKLSVNERKQLLKEAITKYQQEHVLKNVYGNFGEATTVFIMARVMLFDSYQPFVNAVKTDKTLEDFVFYVRGSDQTLNMIVNYAKNYK